MAFQIIQADITNITADAIVNSANPDPVYGRGVDAAIYHAAGADLLLKEREKIGVLSTGEAVATPAFALSAKYIIHTVGPVWAGGESGELLALEACYQNALMLAENLECESIAFPLISTGVYGFPKDRALATALKTIRSFLHDSDMDVYLVVYSRGTYQIPEGLREQVSLYINDKIAEEPVLANAPADQGGSYSYTHLEAAMPKPAPKSRHRGRIGRRISGTVQKGSSLKERMEHISDTFQECLLHWIDEKDMSDVEVYKKANLDRKLFSKIRCNTNYVPKKQTAIALAVALELSLDETKDLLGRAGLALSPSSVSDLIIEYCIENGLYDIYEINSILFDYDQPTLG